MSRFDEDGAALATKGLVLAHVRTANPGALGIATVLILKDTVYNKNLLTTKVSMRIEESLWRPAHQGRPSALLHQWHDI